MIYNYITLLKKYYSFWVSSQNSTAQYIFKNEDEGEGEGEGGGELGMEIESII
jgi:hypothetical protein